MKATIISRTGSLLEELRSAAEAEGYEVAQALLRKGNQPLSSLLADMGGDLLIVDSAGAEPGDDLVTLEALTRTHPSLAVIMLSTSGDANVLIAAMRAGVREVLQSPPKAGELTDALRHVAQRQQAVPSEAGRGRVIAFMSVKPGSGATVLATNLAYLLATAHQKRTALIDLDFVLAEASFFMSDSHGKTNISEVAKQVSRLDGKLLAASMLNVAPNLFLLAAPDGPEEGYGVTAEQMGRVLEVAREHHDFVVIDLVRTPDATVSMKAIDMADFIFVVLEATVPHLRDLKRSLGILRSLDCPDSKLRLIVNRYDKHVAIELSQIEKTIGLKVDYTIPNSFAEVSESLNTGVLLAKAHPKNPVVRGLREIADELVGKPAGSGHSWIGRLLGEQG
ncbi:MULTISPECIES: AAA family ATPase [unclassified Polaromonas]|jgi:pilus assembly protein CpaE|uniref:AAA family ATPase n=1 Tax=unclassified Polaromonas TaxID=2638319 RepID=UPI000BD70EFA|nr:MULTISPECIES: AAA family ATPase [unclassified Polaromonas]OYY36652.1 MAG: hypothetical protein B7Y60_10795 [Polaromonas sp. 35-63-35]OYZ18710.1 MAG: hypothetical protein B7Y28_15005 [Polaromonas sp. 16-63-31]OYZ80903.1 MAG: hypothetical protein B7Y09_00220 [Polaromonas sp. 24-63-21]OZA52883.1 MAG: hypothetical protein B7X88_02935 [Polaromonas sp. 17-63-33]OZA88266.1 MAG: hypothetical protein B7X65_06690 [Polaromonas sp. 39-63-25]